MKSWKNTEWNLYNTEKMLLTLLSIGTFFLAQGPTDGRVSTELGVSTNHLCTVSDMQLETNETCLLNLPGDGSWVLETEGGSDSFRCGVTCALFDERDAIAYHPERIVTVHDAETSVNLGSNTVFAMLGASQFDDGCGAAVQPDGSVIFNGRCDWYVYQGSYAAYTDFEPEPLGGGKFDMNAWSALPVMPGFTHTDQRQYTLNDTSSKQHPWVVRFNHCPLGCEGLCVGESECKCDTERGGEQCQCRLQDMLPEPGYCNMTGGIHACECDSDCPLAVQCVSLGSGTVPPTPTPCPYPTPCSEEKKFTVWMVLFFFTLIVAAVTNAVWCSKYKILKQRHDSVVDSSSFGDSGVYAQFP